MKNSIYYYSGTGNSLWVARNVASRINGADIIHVNNALSGSDEIQESVTGLVFPVYIWGVPSPVLNFIEKLKRIKSSYVFAIAVNGGQVSNTLIQLQKEMLNSGIILNSGFEIKTPSNYIPWGGPGPVSKQKELFDKAINKIDSISKIINNRQTLAVEKGPLWQRTLFSAIYRLSFSHVPSMDNKFTAGDKCTSCGICSKVCPAENISLHDGRPIWNHKCHQCFACLQWCPERAIEYGKNTHKYERYHHPEIKLKDIIQES